MLSMNGEGYCLARNATEIHICGIDGFEILKKKRLKTESDDFLKEFGVGMRHLQLLRADVKIYTCLVGIVDRRSRHLA